MMWTFKDFLRRKEIERERNTVDFKIKLDQAYAEGSRNERSRIIAVLDRAIYNHRDMDSWTKLAREIRDTLVVEHSMFS